MPLTMATIVMEVIAKTVEDWRVSKIQPEEAIKKIGKAIVYYLELPNE